MKCWVNWISELKIKKSWFSHKRRLHLEITFGLFFFVFFFGRIETLNALEIPVLVILMYLNIFCCGCSFCFYENIFSVFLFLPFRILVGRGFLFCTFAKQMIFFFYYLLFSQNNIFSIFIDWGLTISLDYFPHIDIDYFYLFMALI